MTTTTFLRCFSLIALATTLGCGDATIGGSAFNPGTGGELNPGAGGGFGTGGTAGDVGTGGFPGTGGEPGTGGIPGTGGMPGTGGSPPPIIGDQEARCAELGAACLCSETLNTPGDLTQGQHWNPPNSTQKECPGENNNGAFITQPGYPPSDPSAMVRAADVRPFPSGANPWIYSQQAAGVSHGRMADALNVQNETVCVRSYRRWSDGFRMNDVANRVKVMTLTADKDEQSWENVGGHHINIEFAWNNTSAYITSVDSAYSEPDNSTFDSDFQKKCSDDGWCRLEICADHSGNEVWYRHIVTSLTTGETNTYTRYGGTGPTVFHYNQKYTGIQFFVQGGLPGRQYASHAMQARVPYNPNFTIGCAYELEGEGCQ